MKSNKMINQDINPNYQISGIEPNYSYNNIQNLPFDQSTIATSGYNSNENLQKAVEQQQQFVNNYNNYNPISTFNLPDKNSSNLENLRNLSQYNINNAFQQNKPIQLMPDTKNKHETLYDNLNDNLLKENICEYRLNIDSIDRNIELYPDPFNYVIQLGPVTNSGINASVSRTNIKNEVKLINKKQNIRHTDNTTTNIKNEIKDSMNEKIYLFDNPNAIKQYTINLEKSVNPYIIRDFVNVSYIKLDCAVVPKYSSICINNSWDYCRHKHHKKNFFKDDYDRIKDYVIMNQRYIPNDRDDYNPLGDRFIQIYIKEIQNTRNFGTNSITDKSFLLIYDKTLGALYLKLIPYSASKTYKDSLLGSITKLSIQFYDSWGKPLKINTSNIDFEKNQILNTKIIDPNMYSIDNIKDEKEIIHFIENLNEIIKCFVLINSNIELLIPFYNQSDIELDLKFHDDCCEYKKININQNIFKIKDIFKELNSFVTNYGFVEKIKITKTNKKVKLTINEFLNNLLWYDLNFEYKSDILENLNLFSHNYMLFGFEIIDLLKQEIINIPVNRNFQNFLTFVVGIWEDELNTKKDYYN